jgi:hypothetical protein
MAEQAESAAGVLRPHRRDRQPQHDAIEHADF